MPEPLRAIDANVLLRYLLNDVPELSAKARRTIESDQALGVTAVVLAELAWVLTGQLYRFPRATVAHQLIDLLARQNIETIGVDKVEAQIALLACADPTGAANFGDALIAACARSAGVTEIYTFDRKFARAGMLPIFPD